VLGTAVVVPFRHPLVTSQLYGGISHIAGGSRIIAGIGAGNTPKSFEAVGLDIAQRVAMAQELAGILKASWAAPSSSFQGKHWSYEDVAIDPRPPADTPIWYGGPSPAAARRAREYADGWLGRCPFPVLDRLLDILRPSDDPSGKRMGVGVLPHVYISASVRSARDKVNVRGLLEGSRRRSYWRVPLETADDLDGLLIAGSPDDCIASIRKFVERDVDQVIFDLRLRPDEYGAQLELLMNEVLPAFR
jgi:alkanesulfonate monooxygenase SsuD/methylene tetrahydromethanopterin reductase-like flavin-dependent oxidoreductase (luciferase family)